MYLSISKLTIDYRDKFDQKENEAKKLLPDCDYKAATTRKIKRKKMPNDGNVAEINLTPKESFRFKTYNVIIDKLNSSLQERGKIYGAVASKFEFLISRKLTLQECNTVVKTLCSITLKI